MARCSGEFCDEKHHEELSITKEDGSSQGWALVRHPHQLRRRVSSRKVVNLFCFLQLLAPGAWLTLTPPLPLTQAERKGAGMRQVLEQ
eukprot:1665313-Rhodomonas_salina.1